MRDVSARLNSLTNVTREDRLIVVAGRSSRWAQKRSLRMSDLLKEPWVDVPANTPVDAFMVARLRALRVTLPPATVRTYSMHVRNYLRATALEAPTVQIQDGLSVRNESGTMFRLS